MTYEKIDLNILTSSWLTHGRLTPIQGGRITNPRTEGVERCAKGGKKDRIDEGL